MAQETQYSVTQTYHASCGHILRLGGQALTLCTTTEEITVLLRALARRHLRRCPDNPRKTSTG